MCKCENEYLVVEEKDVPAYIEYNNGVSANSLDDAIHHYKVSKPILY